MNKRWDESQIPDQTGRVAVITGANTGIGFPTALILARRGATVVLACRNEKLATEAAHVISAQTGNPNVTTAIVDLGDLNSVRAAAGQLAQQYSRIDLLINNAGVLLSTISQSAEGVETQMAVNHLGHFVWTGLLLESLLRTPGSRVVSVSSMGHRAAKSIADGLHCAPQGDPFQAYGQSKLANLLFTYELQRRLSAAKAPTIATVAHPGGSKTSLIRGTGIKAVVFRNMMLQSADMGALQTLRAAIDPAATGGEYFGPRGPLEFFGYPVRVRSSAYSYDTGLQQKLWLDSEKVSGVRFPV